MTTESSEQEALFIKGHEIGRRMSVTLCALTKGSLRARGIECPSLDTWTQTWFQVAMESGGYEASLSVVEGFPLLVVDRDEFAKGIMTLWAASHFVGPQIMIAAHADDPMPFNERFRRAMEFLDKFEVKEEVIDPDLAQIRPGVSS
jgi:hypothetical protein